MSYNIQHLKLLIDELVYAYQNHYLDDFDRIKKQIKELRSMLNYYESQLKTNIYEDHIYDMF
jgi:hypothetical protein